MMMFALLAALSAPATAAVTQAQGPLWDVQKTDGMCSARALSPTPSGSRFYIHMLTDGSVRLEMTNTNWSAASGRSYPAFTLNIDGQPVQGNATGMRRNGQGGISFTVSQTVLNTLSQGRTLSLRNSDTAVDQFSLSGSSAAVSGLRRCQGELQTAATEAAARAAQRDPFAAANAAPAARNVPAGASVITNPQWSRSPAPTERDFPQRALDRGVSGSATVECNVTPSGRPEGCRVVQEQPLDMGYGQAAIRIVQRGQLSPRTVDGSPTGAKFTVRIPFNLGD